MIDKVNAKTPQRNELKIPWLFSRIISWTSFAAFSAAAARTGSGAYISVERVPDEVYRLNKILNGMTSVEQSFDFHSLSFYQEHEILHS